MKGNRHTVILEYRVPLGNNRRTVARNRTTDSIANARHANSAKFHDSGARDNRAAAGGFVTNSNDSFHKNSQTPLIVEIKIQTLTSI
jgi:hypothetical protein